MSKINKKAHLVKELDLYNTSGQEFITAVAEGIRNKRPLLGEGGLFTTLLKQAVEYSMQVEMDSHLEEERSGGVSNRKNGLGSKTIKSAAGSFELEVPRDRNGSFEPQLIKKRQTSLPEELENKILALYGLGNSYDAISSHLQEIYGTEVSAGTISAITDKLIPQISEWRSRPLEAIYPIIFLDAMYFKTHKDGKVATSVLYNIMGVNQEGRKEVLGFYACESEGSHFWLGILNDLKSRGVEDILIACIDGLKGFPEAINAAFPKTEVQLCIVHQIRNSLKYVASKNQKEFMADLKAVYKAATKDLAEHNLLLLEEKWGLKYPMVIKSWQVHWSNLSTYFKYSEEIKRLIYTTNPIEAFHRQVRKYTKTKGAFTSENALFKLVFCAIKQITKKWSQPLQNWALTISQIDIYFPDRIKLGR